MKFQKGFKKMKRGKTMKLISGCLAMVSFLSTVFSPAVAYAEVPTDEKIPY